MRFAQHGPQLRALWDIDFLRDSEAVTLIEGDVRFLGRFQIRGDALGIAAAQRGADQRGTDPGPLGGWICSEYGEVPVRHAGVKLDDSIIQNREAEP